MNYNNESGITQENSLIKEKPIDAHVTIIVGNDLLSAYISVDAPQFGGKEATVASIIDELRKKQVKYGIDEERLQAIVENPVYYREFKIASGIKPEDGIDGTITFHKEIERSNRPKERDDGSVDFWSLDILLNVNKGDLLCSITKATPGTNGMSVLGTVLPAKPGRNVNLPAGKNIIFNEARTEVYAGIDGNLVFKSGQLHVNPVFEVRGDVDLSTGNIDFIGNVIITGNVREGFKVNARGDVTINGMVEAASIKSGGNVVIRGGIFGSVRGEIQCEGDLKCKYVESSNIRCKGNITTEYMLNSTVICEGEIELVGHRALIAGGDYVVLKKIQAKSVGSTSGSPTRVQLGSYGTILEKKHQQLARLEEISDNENKLAQIIAYLTDTKKRLGQLPEEREKMLTDSIHTKTKMLLEKSMLSKSIEQLDTQIEYEGKQSLAVAKTLYRGTTIAIKNAVFTASEDYYRKTFYYDEKKGAIGFIDWA